MKSREIIVEWSRVLLGAYLIIYALNQFLHFLPTSYGDMPENTRDFLDSVVVYLPFLYAFEIFIGLMLIFNIWIPIILIILFPLSVSFLIFTIANQDFREMWPALLVAILNLVLVFDNRKIYFPLFE